MYSTLGEMEMAPRRCAPGPGQAGEVGQRVEGQVHLARGAAQLVAPHLVQEAVRRACRAPAASGTCGGGPRWRPPPWPRSPRRPPAPRPPPARPSPDALDGAPAVRISTPASRAAPAMALLMAPVPPREKPPGAEGAVDLAHVVVEQHVGGARASARPGRCR